MGEGRGGALGQSPCSTAALMKNSTTESSTQATAASTIHLIVRLIQKARPRGGASDGRRLRSPTSRSQRSPGELKRSRSRRLDL